MYNKKRKHIGITEIEETALYLVKEYPLGDDYKNDLECWRRYYSQMEDRFKYLTEIGQFSLPTTERKIPLQKKYIDFLISKKSRRPFKYNVYIDSKSVRESKYHTDIREFVDFALQRTKVMVYDLELKTRTLDKNIQQLQSVIAQQESSQQNGTQVDPVLYEEVEGYINQLSFIKQQLAEDLDLGQEIIDDYKSQKKMTPTAILEKIMTKYLKNIEKEVKFNLLSFKAFKSKLVTGKSAFIVAKFNNDKPVIRQIKPSGIIYPIDGTEKSINKKDWAFYCELMSIAQINEYFGEVLIAKYGNDILDKLNNEYSSAGDTNTMYALPDGGAIFGNEQIRNNNYGRHKNVEIKWVWFRGSMPICRKTTSDKYGNNHKHILRNGNIINTDDYNYSKGVYTHKTNKDITHKKDSVETYSKKKGEKIETRYFDKLYHAVVLNDEYIINASEWKNTVRDVDLYNRFNLPIFGPSFDDETDQPYSLIRATNDIQDLIDIIHIAREYMVSVAGTKSNIIDISQKPDYMSDDEWQMNMKLGKYYIQTMDSLGVPKRTSFNQFQSFDNSLSQGIQYYEAILDSLTNLMGSIIGVSYQSLGEVVATDQVKTNQIAIQQTSLITEILFYEHSILEKEVLEETLNLEITSLDKEDLIFSDVDHSGTKEYILKTKKIGDNNVRVNLYNAGEDHQKLQDLRQVALQMHNQLGMAFSSIVKIWNAETVEEMESKVKYFEGKEKDLLAQQAQAASQQETNNAKAIEEHKTEMEAYLKGLEDKFKQAELELRRIEISVQERKDEFDQKAKLIELGIKNRKNDIDFMQVKEDTAVEKSMLKLDDKHQNIDEQIRLLEIGVNARLRQQANKISSSQANKPLRSEKTINDN